MKKRWLALCLISAMGIMQFTGCGTSGETSNTSASASSSVESTSDKNVSETSVASEKVETSSAGAVTAGSDVTDESADIPAPTSTEPKKIANILAENNEWNQLKMDAMTPLADAWGWEVTVFDSAQDANQQINMVNSAIAQKFDYITIQPVDNAALNPVLKKAVDAGIAVVNCYGQGESDPLNGVVYQNIFGQKEAGVLEAQTYIDQAGDSGKVALIDGLTGADNARLRSEGFHEVLDACPNIQIVQETYCDWDRQKAMAAAQDILTANPDLNAFLVQDDGMAWGVLDAIQQAGLEGKVQIASQGFYESSIPAIKDGSFMFTISYPPSAFGEIDMRLFRDLASGEKPEMIQYVDMELVTKDNVDTAKF